MKNTQTFTFTYNGSKPHKQRMSLTTLPTIHATPTTIPTLNTFINDQASTPNVIGAVPITTSLISQVNNVIIKKVQQIEEDEEMEDVYKLVHYVELKSFIHNLNVSISGFINVDDEIVEQFLSELIDEFEWTSVEDVNLKIVFVHVKKENIPVLLGLNDVELPINLKVTVEQNTIDNQPVDIPVEKLIKVLDKRTKSTKVKDMDYTINENELKDIPDDVLPQLRKDIKEFRLKALENEKKKREKEVLEEKKRAKLQLRKLFEKFRNEDAMDVSDDEDDEEDDGLTDEQYQELENKREQQEMLKKFAVKLQVVHTEEKRNVELVRDLSELQKHESTLDKTLTEDYKLGKFRPSGRNKERELQADEMDRREDVEQETELDNLLTSIKPKINTYIEELMGVEDDEMADYILSIVKEERSKTKLLAELEEPMGEDALQLVEKVWADVEALL